MYLIRPDGTGERRLTAGPEADYNGPLSPDGALLVTSVRLVEGAAQAHFLLYPLSGEAGPPLGISRGPRGPLVARPLGPPRPFGPPRAVLRHPAWLPDGSLLFESDSAGLRDLFRLGSDGRGPTRLTRNPEGNFEPAVSPRGDAVVFVSSRDRRAELYSMRPDGRAVRRLTDTPRDEWAPRWSADGALLSFASDREGADRIYLMRPDGGDVRRLTREGADPMTVEESATFGPRGRRLAYVRRRPGEPSRLTIVDLDTGRTSEISGDGASLAEPAWSPDGEALAFTATIAGTTQIRRARWDGRAASAVTSGPGPNWNPRWLPGDLLPRSHASGGASPSP